MRMCALLRSARQEDCVSPLTKTYMDVGNTEVMRLARVNLE